MKYCIGLDSDGHFITEKLDERADVIKFLKKLQDGDYWANEAEAYMEEVGVTKESGLMILPEKVWISFVQSFEQRGVMEIKKI